MKKNLHLICNAHIDPVWMWEIEEGIAETLSTFRVAADFCEDYKGFIFCHNEAMLYEWVEENDPVLFKRIQKLVKKGRWHIMGGWYLQPDCNLPSGESFVRQILAGKYYFLEKFGVEPKTVINFDAFGHSRGLVDIMKHAGYDSCIFCRPEPDMLNLPGEDFNWVGFDGSKIACHRAYNSYESHRGEADEKIKGWMEKNRGKSVGLVLWGIGNHGGGPSRVDYEKIDALAKTEKEFKLIHSTPEAYFEELGKTETLPDYDGLMNPRYTGCYTTQIRIKMLHRKLENELYMTEKMAAHAMMAGVMTYPAEQIKIAAKDLMMLEFHDILPGSAIQPVEEYSVALAGHGLTELKNIKTRAFLALCSDKKKAEDGTIPVFVYNPHPYEVDEIVEVEYQLPDQNKNPALFANPIVFENGKKIPSQCEHELSNFNVDWRKHSVFAAKLAPGQMKRFDIRIELIPTPTSSQMPEGDDAILFQTNALDIRINRATGLIDYLSINGISAVKTDAFRPLAIADDENSWAHKEKSFRTVKGAFTLMSPEEGTKFSGITCGKIVPSVRIIEDGDIRTVVEAVFRYADSFLCRRYYLPKTGTDIKICDKVYWNEKMTMLKLSVPTAFDKTFIGQTAYGSETLLTNGDEMVSQKWNLISDGENALTVINNGTYGSDCLDGELRITLLRSPGYSAGKSDFSVRKPYIMEQDRFSPFIDQGEHDFEFHITVGSEKERLAHVERETAAVAEKPMVLSFFPIGCIPEKENSIQPFAVLSDDVITLAVFKKAERGNDSVIRLFNPTGQKRKTTLSLPSIAFSHEFELGAYEIKTIKINLSTKSVSEVDLTER